MATIASLALGIATLASVSSRCRTHLYRLAGLTVGTDTILLSGHVFGPSIGTGTVVIGSRCYVNKQCWFDPGTSSIVLDDHVVVAARVAFQGAGHETGSAARRATGSTSSPIHVCRGAWIGDAAIILPGVTIAPGCVIGAGAVVTSDTEPDGVYAGIPARRISDLGVD